jgi:hypothetical protein
MKLFSVAQDVTALAIAVHFPAYALFQYCHGEIFQWCKHVREIKASQAYRWMINHPKKNRPE